MAHWLSTLEKLAEFGETPSSSIPQSIRKKLEQWGERTGAVSVERQGRGSVFRVKSLVILSNEIRAISPQVETESESSRAINLGRFGDTKTGNSRHEIIYYLGKSIGPDVRVSQYSTSVNLIEISTFTGSFVIPISDRFGPWESDFPLLLVENQAVFDDTSWIESGWSGIILYYQGNLSDRLLSWLAKSSITSVTIFPDYDGVGISNFARLKSAVPSANWFWKSGWEFALLKFGNQSLWQKEDQRSQVEKWSDLWDSEEYPDPQLKELIKLMRIEGKMLEQEWVLV